MSESRYNKAFRGAFGLVLLFSFIVVLFVRQRYVHIPFERDEGEYAYAGSLLLHNHLPYRDAYNMKFPGTYFMYAFIMKLGGESVEAIRYGIIVSVLLTAAVVGFVIKELRGGTMACIFGGLVYTTLVGTMDGEGMMANCEHFVNLFAVLGVWALLKYKALNKVAYLFAAGVLLAFAIVMKQYGYAFSLFGGLFLFSMVWRKPPAYVLRALAAFAFGYVLVFAGMVSWLLYNGLWHKFVFLTIKYAYAYLGLTRGNVGKSVAQLVGGAPTVWALAAIALLVAFRFARNASFRIVLGWLAFSILALSTGYYFRVHYFMLAYPAVAVLTGLAFYEVVERFERTGYLVAGAGIVLFFLIGRQPMFIQKPESVFAQHYQWGMFNDMPAVADYVRKLLPPNERLSMFSNEPELYFYANRVSASGFIYNYALFECQPYNTQMIDEFKRQIESNPSSLFVYHNGSLQVCDKQEYERFENWRAAFFKNYTLLSVFRPVTPDSSAFLNADELLNEAQWNNGLRIEFWKRKL